MEYVSKPNFPIFHIIYDLENKTFEFSKEACSFLPEQFPLKFEKEFLSLMKEMKIIEEDNAVIITDTFKELSEKTVLSSAAKEIKMFDSFGNVNWFRWDFLLSEPGKKIIVSVNDINENINLYFHLTERLEYDELTGLYTKEAFKRRVEQETQPYAILYFDIWHFKAINDTYGKAGGDLLLIHIADVLRRLLNGNGYAQRIVADRFAVLLYTDKVYIEQFITTMVKEIADYDLNIHIVCNVGIFINNPDEALPAFAKIDRASIAQSVIKGSYTKIFNYYETELTEKLINEQTITSNMLEALDNNQFVIYYQPQYSHITEKIVGAEGLVRWLHPDFGLISPDKFIPVFEKNSFITTLDMYVFEQVCKFIRKCMNQGIAIVPISTNFSRFDVIQEDFVERLDEIRQMYNVPVEKIRIEITESAVVEGSDYISDVVTKLQECGYIVEMDDFGSGYSSLNVLKDIDFDIIKLDMKFMSNEKRNERGSTILSSVVGMSAKLNMTIIAEGVETELQADFLRDIGCEIIQGYFYSKPIPEAEFLEKIKNLK